MRYAQAALLLILSGVLSARGQTNELIQARSTLEKWVETRRLISQQQTDWRLDREVLDQTIDLFQRENKKLADELATATNQGGQTNDEHTSLKEENEQLKAAAEKLREQIAAIEEEARQLASGFPAPLSEKIQPLIKRMNANDAKEGSLSQRVQNVAGILNEAEKFNGAITVVPEIRKAADGAELQTQTVYLGLGQAYFVSDNGTFAGVGRPGGEGWEWTNRPELAGAIRKAIAIYETSETAALVSLPVEVR